MTAAKSNCKACDAEILQITFDLTEGYCMPCANQRARADKPVSDYVSKRWPKPILVHSSPPDEVLLSVCYSPGWSDDLTSWVIHILKDGLLRQAVQWHTPGVSTITEEELDSTNLPQEDLDCILEILDSCTPEAFRAAEQAMCVDDVSSVSFRNSPRGIRVGLPLFALAEEVKRGRIDLDAVQRQGFEALDRLWSVADSNAPYPIRKHNKANRVPVTD